MPSVFISYARSTEPAAERVARQLKAIGYDVWRDDQLPPHRAYGDVIQERLQEASAVIVLWSVEACQSDWVRAEADYARNAGTLVQASVDGSLPPMPFNQIQCAELKEWNGARDDPDWHKIEESLASLAAPAGDVTKTSAHMSQLSICVLPFQNMSGDAEQEYFSDGISEDITTDLSQVSALSVTARNTAFTFKSSLADVPSIARKLGVSHVLEGSVRKAGNRVRITAQLIDGVTGDHVWAERYDRELTDIFAIQDEISKAIVGALQVKLLPEEKKAIERRGTTSAEAYKLYLMARQYWVSGNHGDRRRDERVIRICHRAIEIDPGYARAWALLAIAQSSLRYWFGQPGDDGVAAAETALSIDPTIAEAHCPIARRFAEEQRFDQAGEEIAVALKLDPESWEVNREAGRLCMAQRLIPEAKFHFEQAVSAMETDFYGWGLQISCNLALGDLQAVRQLSEITLKQADKAIALDPSNGSAIGMSAAALLFLGQRNRAEERLERALLIDPDNLTMRYYFGCAFAMVDASETAIEMLGPFFDRASKAMIAYAENDPDLDSVRNDPRFTDMVRRAKQRVGLVETAPIPAAT